MAVRLAVKQRAARVLVGRRGRKIRGRRHQLHGDGQIHARPERRRKARRIDDLKQSRPAMGALVAVTAVPLGPERELGGARDGEPRDLNGGRASVVQIDRRRRGRRGRSPDAGHDDPVGAKGDLAGSRARRSRAAGARSVASPRARARAAPRAPGRAPCRDPAAAPPALDPALRHRNRRRHRSRSRRTNPRRRPCRRVPPAPPRPARAPPDPRPPEPTCPPVDPPDPLVEGPPPDAAATTSERGERQHCEEFHRPTLS